MDTVELKTKVKELVDSSDDDVLQQVYDMLKESAANEWDAEDIRIYNQEIDEAMKQMDEGHFVTHEDAKKMLQQCLKG
jgi:predicted transcriptional regulator